MNKKKKRNENLAQRIKRFRDGFGFTQQQIADALNIDRSTYSYYESGKTEPNYEIIHKLANIYHTDFNGLLSDEEPPTVVQDPRGNSVLQPNTEAPVVTNTLSDEEKALIIKIRILSKEEKKNLFKCIEDFPRG